MKSRNSSTRNVSPNGEQEYRNPNLSSEAYVEKLREDARIAQDSYDATAVKQELPKTFTNKVENLSNDLNRVNLILNKAEKIIKKK